MKSFNGVIRKDEAYSKTTLLQRLGIGQPFWDRMIEEGLAFVQIGHSRWVTGDAVFRWFDEHSQSSTSTGA